MFDAVHLFTRWLHVLAGIVWIGHLYFFNWVNIPLQGSLDDAGKKAVNPQMMPRALFWFRWGAMITFLAGLVLFTLNYMYAPGVGFGPTDYWGIGGMTQRAWWILMGMTAGTIMWFNVWFIIWPAQKKLLGGKVTGDEAAATRKTAALASRVNTFLSGPMLYGMLGAPHFANAGFGVMAGFIVVGLGSIWAAYKLSTTDLPKAIVSRAWRGGSWRGGAPPCRRSLGLLGPPACCWPPLFSEPARRARTRAPRRSAGGPPTSPTTAASATASAPRAASSAPT